MASSSIRTCALLLAAALIAACGDDAGDAPDSGDVVIDEGDSGMHAHDASTPEHDASSGEPDEDAGFDPHDDAGADEDGSPQADYFPLVSGASWVYRHSGGDTEWDEEVALESMRYQDQPAFKLSDSPGPSGKTSESVLMQLGSRVMRVHRDEYQDGTLALVADYDPGFIRFDRAWLTRPEGFSEEIGYGRVERDAQGIVTADGTRSHRYTIEARAETITVPAGELHDCIRVRRTRMRASGPLQEGDDDRFWFCPGVGKAREEDQVTLKREELVRFAR